MRIGKRLFPYPVLHEGSDDYTLSTFKARMNAEQDGPNALRLSCVAALRSEDLLRLIDEGKAQYAFHFESPATAKRLCYTDRACVKRTSIPLSGLEGRLERCAFVVATQPIENFQCEDWNEVYKGIPFNVRAGSILAYHELDPIIIHHPAPARGGSGVFTIRPSEDITDGMAVVSPEHNRIVIALGEQEFQLYQQYAKSPQFIPMLRVMVLLPALVYLFSQLKTEGGWEQWEDSAWLDVLRNQYAKQGIDLEKEVLETDKDAFTLAQACLASPIGEALTSFARIDGDDGPEEDDS